MLRRRLAVEETQEADDVCSCSAELAHMVRKIESVLAAQAALAMRMEAMLAALGAELVGSDAYSRALALVPLVLAGDSCYSEMVDWLKWGRRRVMAARILQVAVRCRPRRPTCDGCRRSPPRSERGSGMRWADAAGAIRTASAATVGTRMGGPSLVRQPGAPVSRRRCEKSPGWPRGPGPYPGRPPCSHQRCRPRRRRGYCPPA